MTYMKAMLIAVLLLTITACAGMSRTQQRVLSGSAIGSATGAGAALITGGSVGVGAAAGAAVGAIGGLVVDELKK